MSTLTVTAKGQVTLRRDLLEHLGVQPGEKITDRHWPVRRARFVIGDIEHASVDVAQRLQPMR